MFPTKILLATDGSSEAVRAARMATALSGRLGSELHVVHVAPVPSAYAMPESVIYDPEFGERVREVAEREAGEKLAEQVGQIREAGGEVAEAHARVGRPDAEIVRLAEELGAGLVVLGGRGLGPLRRAVMGSVSSSVVGHAHASVLVVRDGETGERDPFPGRILLALDGSREADSASEAAVEVAAGTGSELHVLYVLPPSYAGPGAWEVREESIEKAKQDVRSFVDRQAERMEAGVGTPVEAHVAQGSPDEEIIRLAEKLEAAMIVTGSRGLGGVRRALLGSVSSSVVRHAHCPVLVVRRDGASS